MPTHLFETGNAAAVRHGAWADLRNSDQVQKLTDLFLEERPQLAPFRQLAVAWIDLEVRLAHLRRYLDGLDVSDPDYRRGVDICLRIEHRAGVRRSELGLTPRAYAEIRSLLAHDTARIDEVAAAGRATATNVGGRPASDSPTLGADDEDWPDDHPAWEAARTAYETGHDLRHVQLACLDVGADVTKNWITAAARNRSWTQPTAQQRAEAAHAIVRRLPDRRRGLGATALAVTQAATARADEALESGDEKTARGYALVAQRMRAVSDRALVPDPSSGAADRPLGVAERQQRLLELVDGGPRT